MYQIRGENQIQGGYLNSTKKATIFFMPYFCQPIYETELGPPPKKFLATPVEMHLILPAQHFPNLSPPKMSFFDVSCDLGPQEKNIFHYNKFLDLEKFSKLFGLRKIFEKKNFRSQSRQDDPSEARLEHSLLDVITVPLLGLVRCRSLPTFCSSM